MLGARPAQAALAEWAGVDRFTCDPAEAGDGYGLVVEAAGAAAATAAALAAPARGGSVVILGFPGQGVTVPLNVDDLVNGDVTVSGSFSYTSAAWASVARELNAGRLDLGGLVTQRFALGRSRRRDRCASKPDGRARQGARGDRGRLGNASAGQAQRSPTPRGGWPRPPARVGSSRYGASDHVESFGADPAIRYAQRREGVLHRVHHRARPQMKYS